MNDEELFKIAKKFGDNYTYGRIVKCLKKDFLGKAKVKHIMMTLKAICYNAKESKRWDDGFKELGL